MSRALAVLGVALLVLAAVAAIAETGSGKSGDSAPIRVGILHSETGSLAVSEIPVIDATLMAIDELNAHGGIDGRKIQVFQLNGQSNDAVFARDARTLIERDKVNVIFGCWTSSCRKTLKPIVEQDKNLLMYPLQYEGLEDSPNIVYLGAAPNQQIIPAVKWFLDNRGKRFFLVGSDYIFPHAANAIIKDYLRLYGGKTVGEAYVPLGGENFTAIAREIKRARPDVILQHRQRREQHRPIRGAARRRDQGVPDAGRLVQHRRARGAGDRCPRPGRATTPFGTTSRAWTALRTGRSSDHSNPNSGRGA